jgi:hypothetical protein
MKKTVLPEKRTTSMQCVQVAVLDNDETKFQKAIDTSNIGEIKKLLKIYDVNEPLFGLGLYVRESKVWDEDFPSSYVHRKKDKDYFKIDGPYYDISNKKSDAFDIVRDHGDYVLWTPLKQLNEWSN